PAAPTPTTSPAPVSAKPAPPNDAVVEQGVASMDDLGANGEADDNAEAARKTTAPPPENRAGRVTFSKRPLTKEVAPPPAPAAVDETEPADTVQETPAESAPAEKVTRAAPYKPLSDMSAAYQGSFPQFTMEVHVYDPAPQRRF